MALKPGQWATVEVTRSVHIQGTLVRILTGGRAVVKTAANKESEGRLIQPIERKKVPADAV